MHFAKKGFSTLSLGLIFLLLIGVSSCQESNLDVQPIPTELVTNSELQSRSSNDFAVDPLYSSDQSSVRGSYLPPLVENQQGKYSADNWSEFVWDLEYLVNHDNWSVMTQDQHLMEFETHTYAVSSYTLTELNAIRNSIEADVNAFLATIQVPSGYKRFSAANVSGNSAGDIIICTIGAGVNVDPCGDVPCPEHYEELHVLQSEGSGTCNLPTDPVFNASARFSSDQCAGEDEEGVLEKAARYTNGADVGPNNSTVPNMCNPVDPTIYVTQLTAPSTNLITHNFFIIEIENQIVNSLDGCHDAYGMFSWSESNQNCDGVEPFCIENPEALYLMQDGIGTAISAIHGQVSFGTNLKFVCTPDYVVDFIGGTSYYGSRTFTWWTVE